MRLPRSLQWRIALAYTGLIVLSMAAASAYIIVFVKDSYISDLEVRLDHEAGLISQSAERYFQGQVGLEELQMESEQTGSLVDARVTVVSLDGTVLADTWRDPGGMDSQAGRPEVKDALATGLGRSARFSTTVDQEMMYAAVPVSVDDALVGTVRVAVPTSRVQSKVNDMIAAVALSGLLVTALSAFLGYFIARRTSRSVRLVAEGARRLAQGDLEHQVSAPSGDESRELADALNSMAATLGTTLQELGAERSRLSAILETMADGVVMIGAEGEVVLLNQVARNLLEIRAPDTQGRRFIELSRDYELQSLVSRSLETGDPQYGEIELPQRRFLNAIAMPLLQSDSSPGVLLTLNDLSRVRQLDTTRTEFVSNVSHELRSPLASIKATVETLENGALREPEVARDFVRRIHGDVDRMISMVGELLELSRLESGHVPLHLYPLDLKPLMEDVKATFEGPAEAGDIALSVVSDQDLPLALGDGDKLRQVLVNLLDNAIKFTPKGGRVTIEAGADERYVGVRVRDAGIGISREHLPHIFERFYKVDRSRRDRGAGLGLAIVKHIVQLQGGDVNVESAEGEGSTFSFTIPRNQ